MKKKNLLSILLIVAMIAALSISVLGASDGSTMQTAVEKYLTDMNKFIPLTYTLPDVEAALEWGGERETYYDLSIEEQVMVGFGIYGRLTEDEIAGLSEEAAGLIEKAAGRLTCEEGEPLCLTVAPYADRVMQTNFHIVLASVEEDGEELSLDERDALVLLRHDDILNVIRVKTKLHISYAPPRTEPTQPSATPYVSASPSSYPYEPIHSDAPTEPPHTYEPIHSYAPTEPPAVAG